MNLTHKILIAAVLAAAAVSAASAQPASGPGPGGGPGAMRMGPGNTPGWGMMTKEERALHHDKMRSMKSHGECSDYMAQHHAQMMDRAKEKGRAAPTKPRYDGCAWLKK